MLARWWTIQTSVKWLDNFGDLFEREEIEDDRTMRAAVLSNMTHDLKAQIAARLPLEASGALPKNADGTPATDFNYTSLVALCTKGYDELLGLGKIKPGKPVPMQTNDEGSITKPTKGGSKGGKRGGKTQQKGQPFVKKQRVQEVRFADNKDGKCTYCGKPGHTESQCFSKKCDSNDKGASASKFNHAEKKMNSLIQSKMAKLDKAFEATMSSMAEQQSNSNPASRPQTSTGDQQGSTTTSLASIRKALQSAAQGALKKGKHD